MNRRLPGWAPLAALTVSLVLAWLNFIMTAKWAALPGALNGPRKPLYAAALLAATVLTIGTRRHVGNRVRIGQPWAFALLVSGAVVLVAALLSRLPPAVLTQIPF
jgi:hypothetical protein